MADFTMYTKYALVECGWGLYCKYITNVPLVDYMTCRCYHRKTIIGIGVIGISWDYSDNECMCNIGTFGHYPETCGDGWMHYKIVCSILRFYVSEAFL